MALRSLLIALLLLRAMLGPACGQTRAAAAASGAGPDGCCCCDGSDSCYLRVSDLPCLLCAACEGRVPALPPFTGSIDPEWRAILDLPDVPQPPRPDAEAATPAIVGSQVVATGPLNDRLRSTICIWTI
jgi:hypothetical protein